jgi:hypothetical protein
LSELASVFSWRISGCLYFRCAIFGVIFDFALQQIQGTFSKMAKFSYSIIYALHLVCQELNNTIYKELTFFTNSVAETNIHWKKWVLACTFG